jgi:hypothetical protein
LQRYSTVGGTLAVGKTINHVLLTDVREQAGREASQPPG